MKTLSRVFFTLLACCLASQAIADALFADRVLVNGNILTVDAKDSVAEAIKNMECQMTLLEGKVVHLRN